MPPEDFNEESRIDLVTANGVIFLGRCVLHSVLLAADGANGDCQVFDSKTGNSGEKFHIESLSGTTFGWHSTDGVPFHKGLYVKVNAATSHVMIEWHPIPPSLRGRHNPGA